ncbi:MAG: TlpA family protein disulfide reductase [Gammaproteobacteria bacterium]
MIKPTTIIGVFLLSGFFSDGIAADIGEAAPDCTLSVFSDDRKVDIDHYRGEVLYVDFWASWCPPCAKSFHFLNSTHRQFHSRGLKILAVNLDEESEDARRFLIDNPVEFAILSDQDASCANSFDVKGMPSSYLVDRQGVIRHIHLGFRPADTEELTMMIQDLVNEKSAESFAMGLPNGPNR